MDEPTGNLDPDTAEQVMQLIESLSKSDSAFVLVTHDPMIASNGQPISTGRWFLVPA